MCEIGSAINDMRNGGPMRGPATATYSGDACEAGRGPHYCAASPQPGSTSEVEAPREAQPQRLTPVMLAKPVKDRTCALPEAEPKSSIP